MRPSSPLRARPVRLCVLGLALATTACVTTPTGPATPTERALIVSAAAIVELGKQAKEVGDRYNLLLDAKIITEAQYKPWRVFIARFRIVYPALAEAWNAARLSNDALKQQDVEAAIQAISRELAALSATVFALMAAPGTEGR